MLIGFALLLIVGVCLLLVGLRGRRVDDHPLCRRCRFDLTGRPTSSDRCPECGSDLGTPRAMVVGHRRRRRGLLAGGVALLVLTVGVGGVLGWGRANQVNWLTYAPVRYLLHEATSADPARRTPALAELSARAARLTPGQWDAVADAAVAYQADANKPWDTGWDALLQPAAGHGHPSAERWARYLDGLAGQATSPYGTRRTAALTELTRRLADSPVDGSTWAHVVATGLDYQGDLTKPWEADWGTLLEGAQASGHLSGPQWARYARQAMPPTMFGLRLRPRVRRGDPLPYWLDEKGGRAAQPSKLQCRIADMRVAWDGHALPPKNEGWSSGGFGGGGATGSAVQPRDFPPGLADGTQHVRLTATATVRPLVPGTGDVNDKLPPLATCHIDLPGTFDLLPADRPTVKVVHDPALTDAVRRSLKVDSVTQQAGSYPYINVNVHLNGPPTDLAFQIVLVQAGHETPAGTLACPAGTGDHSFGTGGNGRLSGPTCDVIFRGDPTVAAGTTDTFTVWDGQVVFKGVPVK